jgi:sugar phosphate permease
MKPLKTHDAGAWSRQPVVWLGAAILFASIVACIVTIVLAMRHADTPVETAGGAVFKVPLRNAHDKP